MTIALVNLSEIVHVDENYGDLLSFSDQSLSTRVQITAIIQAGKGSKYVLIS